MGGKVKKGIKKVTGGGGGGKSITKAITAPAKASVGLATGGLTGGGLLGGSDDKGGGGGGSQVVVTGPTAEEIAAQEAAQKAETDKVEKEKADKLAAEQSAAREQEMAKKRRGPGSTVLTGTRGLSEEAPLGARTLLGMIRTYTGRSR